MSTSLCVQMHKFYFIWFQRQPLVISEQLSQFTAVYICRSTLCGLAPPNEKNKQHCAVYQSVIKYLHSIAMETSLLLSPRPASVLVPPLLLQQPQPRIRAPTNFVPRMFLGSEYLWILFWDSGLHLFKKSSLK